MGINERIHYSTDVVVKKIMEEEKSITLQEAVSRAGWTHNNVKTLGFTPLQLANGKNARFLGVSKGNIVTESLYDDGVKKIMERHDN